MEGKCRLSFSRSRKALRKRWDVQKASVMLLDLSGRKCPERDPATVSGPIIRRLSRAKLRLQLNGASES